MERLIEFAFAKTRYFVWRQGEWGFFVAVTRENDRTVDLAIDQLVAPGILNPRWVPLTSEGPCLEMERRDGSEEDVTFTLEELHEAHALVRMELPEGVQLELQEDRTT